MGKKKVMWWAADLFEQTFPDFRVEKLIRIDVEEQVTEIQVGVFLLLILKVGRGSY